jgi:hypothetical protein
MAGDDDGPVAKDYVAIRVNVSTAQLDQVLSALAIAVKDRARFTSGQIFILQKKSPTGK